MQESNDKPSFEPTMLGALWRYRWLMLALLISGGSLGVLYVEVQPARHEAAASFVVQDPQANSVFATASSQRPERFVADQVAILQSTVVAERASQLAAEIGLILSADDILEDTQVISDPESDYIEVRLEAATPEAAVVGVNSIAETYQAIRRESAAQSYASALEQLDQSIAGVADDLVRIGEDIATQLAPDPAREELDRQFAEALVRLADLQQALAEAPVITDATTPDPTRQALDDLLLQFQTLEVVVRLEEQSPQVTVLLDQQREAIGRQSALIQRRDELKVDAQLESTGIIVFAPAMEAEKSTSLLPRALTVGLIFGGFAGAAASYLLALRRRPFSDHLQPGPILGVPFLGEVPEFRDEGIQSELPVYFDPASATAEAFRFVAAALDAQLGDQDLESLPGLGRPVFGRRPVRSLLMVSGRPGDGKTVVAANTALASARRGNRVLVIDADFGNQRLATLLSAATGPGLSEVVEKGTPLAEVVQAIELPGGVTIDLLARGLEVVTAPEFFRSPAAQAFLAAVRDEYDLVLIDAPPLLQVAYTSTIARFVDRVLVVIRHQGDSRAAKEVAERLALLGTDAVGYVYNRAPLRNDMIRSEGSLKDVLGRGPRHIPGQAD